jgi:hypothetical protein
MKTSADVDSYLTSHQKQRLLEKGAYGEVFTPISVIDTMLAMLPGRVWSDVGGKWCDPACGLGHFPLKVIFGGKGYSGLFAGLRSQFASDAACFSHILQKMLVCYDINPENAEATRRVLVSLCSGCVPRVEATDFLTSDTGMFTVIVGNPPYNSGGLKRSGEKRLHVRFTEHALRLLDADGMLLFVCPPNYREAGSVMNRLFHGSSGHFSHIRIYGPDETHRLFRVQTRVDAFLWSVGTSGKTTIVDQFGATCRIQLDLDRHIPNFGHTLFEKLRAVGSADVKAFRSAEATTIVCEKSGYSRDGSGKYPTLHLIVEGGRKILYRNRAHSLQSVPKIILNGLGLPYVYYDKEGAYGVTQTPVVVLDPPAKLVKFMKSPLFQCIVWGLRITGNNNMPYLFQDIPSDYGDGLTLTTAEEELVSRFSIPVFSDNDIRTVCSEGRRSTRKLKKIK